MNRLFIVICIFVFIYMFMFNNDKDRYININSKRLKSMDIFTDDGEKIFREYLLYYFNRYLQNTKKDWNYITPIELYNIKNKKNLFLLDVRKQKDFKKSHIKGSTNIFWLNLLKKENLKKIPKDKEIIIICYVGHTSSQLLVMLKLLGYKAKVLKFGYGISPDKNVPIAGWVNTTFEPSGSKVKT